MYISVYTTDLILVQSRVRSVNYPFSELEMVSWIEDIFLDSCKSSMPVVLDQWPESVVSDQWLEPVILYIFDPIKFVDERII